MKKTVRIAVVVTAFVALSIGVSSLMAKPGGRPLPPPPVLCGCLCPDGSLITVHAKKANQCPRACESACEAGSDTF